VVLTARPQPLNPICPKETAPPCGHSRPLLLSRVGRQQCARTACHTATSSATPRSDLLHAPPPHSQLPATAHAPDARHRAPSHPYSIDYRQPLSQPTAAYSSPAAATARRLEPPLKLVLWRAASMWISTRASLEMPAEFAPAGDSIAGAPAKKRRDYKSADFLSVPGSHRKLRTKAPSPTGNAPSTALRLRPQSSNPPSGAQNGVSAGL
jgi:hypothetical protein